MLLKLPDSWLREYLETDATPLEIKEYLSLCGPTVERIDKIADDFIYTIEVSPNRVDVMSLIGIAREAKAILPKFGKKGEIKNIPDNTKLPKFKNGKKSKLKVEIKDPSLCPHFLAVVLDNVEVKKSPNFLAERIEKCGLRSLNNVVDISNYVMLETGQPLHIFDYDKIDEGLMTLRESLNGEKLETLDGISRDLPSKTIIIQDKNKIIDLCGIMGGENSAVDRDTERVVLFAQRYSPTHIRRTYRNINLITEAALLFEKGLDPLGVIPAFNRALELLKKYTKAQMASEPINITNEQYEPNTVELEINQLQKYLAVRISVEDALAILKSLGFEVSLRANAFQPPKIVAKPPSYRASDIKIPEDLIEEIARIFGYHNIPTYLPEGKLPNVLIDRKFFWEDKSKDYLLNQGFFEVLNFSFISKKLLNMALFDEKKALKVKNPLNKDLAYLRTSLIPHILKNTSENRNYADNIRLYELERIYLAKKKTELPVENYRLTGIIYDNQKQENLFFDAKGVLESLFYYLGLRDVKFTQTESPNLWHPARTALITTSKKQPLGVLGEIHPRVLTKFSLEGRGVVFDLNMDIITSQATDIKVYEPIIDHPSVIEDLSIIIDKKTPIADLTKNLSLNLSGDLKPSKVKVIDIYTGKPLTKLKKSVTFRISYLSRKRLLSTEDVKKIREKIIKEVETKFKAKVRRK